MKRAGGETFEDVYIYDKVPEKLRIQISQILKDSIGSDNYSAWEIIHSILLKELGTFKLIERPRRDPIDNCIAYFLECYDEDAIDFIELSLRMINSETLYYDYEERAKMYGIIQSPKEAIEEMNYRLKDHSLGYEFIEGEFIRIDRKFLHEATVKPAIRLLIEEDFEGAGEEFLQAHDHYRKGKYKESLVEALKAFESTLKTICDKQGYTYDKNRDTASKLITIIIDNELVPKYLSTHFTGLRTTLESGLPTVRNKMAGHGQGAVTVKVEPYFVEYALNLAASNIVLLINAYKEAK